MTNLKRIGWKDEPSEDTPIDSGNLKQMENNFEEYVQEEIGTVNRTIEDVKSKILYTNADGIVGNITLSESAANYEYLEICYVSDNFYNSVTVRNPNNKKICLLNNYCVDNKQCMYMSAYNIVNNMLNHVASRNNFISENNEIGNYGNTQYLRITSVVGRNN